MILEASCRWDSFHIWCNLYGLSEGAERARSTIASRIKEMLHVPRSKEQRVAFGHLAIRGADLDDAEIVGAKAVTKRVMLIKS